MCPKEQEEQQTHTDMILVVRARPNLFVYQHLLPGRAWGGQAGFVHIVPCREEAC